MSLKRRIERLKEWACDKEKRDCYYCKYSIREDRAKEGESNDKS